MDDLIALLDKMWDEKLLNTTKSGSYYKTHPTMHGNWMDADTIRKQIRQELLAMPPTPPTPTDFNFEEGNFGDKYFGQAAVSAIRRLFSRVH